jgi:Spy/CpxP family protein refolding chaperone
MKNYFLSLIFLLGLAAMVSAQDDVFMQVHRNTMKRTMSSFWDGNGSYLMMAQLLQEDYFRKGIGISQEQEQKLFRSMIIDTVNDPAFKPYHDEMVKLTSEMPGGPFGENVSEEARTKFFERQVDIQMKIQDALFKKMTSIVTENLTPDQMNKVKEFQISMMGEIPVVSPNMFEALDLSDVQKQQFEEIKKEMEPEFLKSLDRVIDTQVKFTEKMMDELSDELKGVTDGNEHKRIAEEAARNVRKSNPDLQREMAEVMESGKLFSDKLKFRMFDVLTDEQLERMAQLIDNPPDYAQKAIAQIRRQMGNDDSPTSECGEWRPGQNSWKPGDPIPAEYLEQRQERRFPRREQ